MDILDILVAKNQSFTAETAKLTKQAQAAMAKANQVAAKADAAQDALDAAEAANTRAQEVAAEFDSLKSDVDAAVSDIVDEKIATVTEDITTAKADAAEAKETAAEAITDVEVIDDNTSTAKVKKVRTRKKGIARLYETMKNYITTGTNEDGGMTQKAITNALNAQKTELENKIKNIKPSGGGSGNISGDISAEDAGSVLIVGEDGNITASNITEDDLIRTQIALGTYQDNKILGIEVDYENKTCERIQSAQFLDAGTDFNRYTMYGGRKRCVVDSSGNIITFIGNNINNIPDGNIMVYQPAFYYMRIPISVTTDDTNGIKINKEQILIAESKISGFSIAPIFIDKNGNELKYVLLPAFESSAVRADGSHVLNDEQNVDLVNSQLASISGAKPISGQTQAFTIDAARKMANNIGEGWSITNLEAESALQMLMIIEFNSFNMQVAFNKGVTEISKVTGKSCSATTGATISLGNDSGQAISTTITIDNNSTTYTEAGKCSISYRGMENPYGNMWRFIDNLTLYNTRYTLNNNDLAFTDPGNTGWIGNFGYDQNNAWAFLPMTVSSDSNSLYPIGDAVYAGYDSEPKLGIIGGYATSNAFAGLFAYGFDMALTDHSHTCSARIMHKPVAGSLIESNNYNKWLQIV